MHQIYFSSITSIAFLERKTWTDIAYFLYNHSEVTMSLFISMFSGIEGILCSGIFRNCCRIRKKHLCNEYLASIYQSKINNRHTRKGYEIWYKLTIKKPERHRCRSDVFIINFEHVSILFYCFYC